MAKAVREIPWLDTRDGTYYVNWYDKHERRTKRQSLFTKDADAAQAKFGFFLTEGMHNNAGAAGLTVPEVLDRYMREHVESKCAAPRRQRQACDRLSEFYKNHRIGEVTALNSRAYFEWRTKPTSQKANIVAPTTVRRELGVLAAAAKHCAKWGHIPKTDIPFVDLPRGSKGARSEEVKFLSRAEVDTLLNTADEKLLPFITLAYYTAARRTSIMDLTVEQVRLGEKRIYLLPSGGKQTNKRRPIVPIFPEMVPVLEKLIAGRTTGKLFAQGFDVYRAFRAHCQACGFTGRHNPHILRHSRATHLLQSGKWSLWQVAKLLGDTVATTESYYGHFVPEFLPTE